MQWAEVYCVVVGGQSKRGSDTLENRLKGAFSRASEIFKRISLPLTSCLKRGKPTLSPLSLSYLLQQCFWSFVQIKVVILSQTALLKTLSCSYKSVMMFLRPWAWAQSCSLTPLSGTYRCKNGVLFILSNMFLSYQPRMWKASGWGAWTSSWTW